MKQTTLAWYRLRWPREVEPEQLVTLGRLLPGAGRPVVVEAVGARGVVTHHLGVPVGCANAIVGQMRAALPGLGIEPLVQRPLSPMRHAVELRLSTPRRPIKAREFTTVSRALLTALAAAKGDECLVLQWQLHVSVSPSLVPNAANTADGSWLWALLAAPVRAPQHVDADARTALRQKHEEAVWRAIGRLAVTASDVRGRPLIRGVLAALQLVEAPGVRIIARRTSVDGLSKFHRPWRLPLRLNTSEVVALSSWPVEATAGLPIARVTSRPLPPSSTVPSHGRVIGRSTFPGAERSVAVTTNDSLRHLHVLGPTGVGKSTLLLNLITQDLAAGRGVLVIEPKRDLITAVLERIPAERMNDVVVLDPTDEIAPVGFNPLAARGRSPELIADQLLGVMHRLYAELRGGRGRRTSSTPPCSR